MVVRWELIHLVGVGADWRVEVAGSLGLKVAGSLARVGMNLKVAGSLAGGL